MKLLLILTLLVGCSKEISLSKKNGVYFFKDFSLKMTSAEELDWNVGLKKDKNVSTGIVLKIELPRLEKDFIPILYDRYKVDSWIFKINKIRPQGKMALGHIVIPFNKVSQKSSNFSVHIYYAAAAASKRFRLFHCPAFSHRKKIKDIELVKTNPKVKNLFVGLKSVHKGKTDGLEYFPIIMSGQRSLVGKYNAQVALYSTKNSGVYSKYIPVNGDAIVSREEEVSVPSCNGIKEEIKPLKESRQIRLQDLEIK